MEKKKQFSFTFSINRSNHNSKIRVRVQFKTILKRKLPKFMFLFFFRLILKRGNLHNEGGPSILGGLMGL